LEHPAIEAKANALNKTEALISSLALSPRSFYTAGMNVSAFSILFAVNSSQSLFLSAVRSIHEDHRSKAARLSTVNRKRRQNGVVVFSAKTSTLEQFAGAAGAQVDLGDATLSPGLWTGIPI
jgi:hypothetical protein